MKKITLSFDFVVTDERAFLRHAHEVCEACWGSGLRDLITGPDDTLLGVAAYEVFVASNGNPSPDLIGINLTGNRTVKIEEVDR